MKRLFASLLVLSMFLSAVSCSSKEDTPETDVETGSAESETEIVEEKTLENLLAKADFEGRDFRISCNSTYSYEMAVDEFTGDICNDAIYQRNLKINDLYHVNIKTVITEAVDGETHINDVINTVTAGLDAYDLTGIYAYQAGNAAIKGCFHPWCDVPVVDFSKEWWNQSANEAFSIAGKQYTAVGDLSITTLLMAYGVFFNQQLAVNYNLPDLYETVKNGEWTVDKLIELSSSVYVDVNGNGKADAGDTFGFGAEKATNLDPYPASFGIDIISRDENNLPVIQIDQERFVAGLEKVYKLYYDSGSSSMIFIKAGDEIKEFAAGNLLFVTTWMEQAFSTFREMKDDYGILPYPKLEAAQDRYYSEAMDNYSLLSVPVTVTELEFVGHITEALNIESSLSVYPAYYDVALTEKYARNQASQEMLDIITNGFTFDFSVLHNSNLNRVARIFRDLIAAKSTDFASNYAQNKEAREQGLASLINSYKELGNR